MGLGYILGPPLERRDFSNFPTIQELEGKHICKKIQYMSE